MSGIRNQGSAAYVVPRVLPPSGTVIWLIACKEAGELMFSPRGLGSLLTVASVLSAFGLLLISDTELGLLDNAQVVYDMVGVAVALGALIAIVAGVDSIGGERERGSLVPLLLAPAPRSALFWGKFAGVAAAWPATVAITLPYLWAIGSTGQNFWSGMAALIVLGTPVVLAFGAFSVGLGARLGSVAGALSTALAILVLAGSPVVIGPGLRRTAIGAGFDLINPFSAALNAVDAVVIDGERLVAHWPAFAIAMIWVLVAASFAWIAMRRLAR
jgi:ABC-type transport system involved in multi-copper enzyme maturation permease subunit